jgi:predicted ATPase
MEDIRSTLEAMASHLGPADRKDKPYLRALAAKTAHEIANDVYLWGGMGSLLDQSHIPDPLNQRVAFERAAIQLARALVAAGASNGRVEWWAAQSRAPSDGVHDV